MLDGTPLCPAGDPVVLLSRTHGEVYLCVLVDGVLLVDTASSPDAVLRSAYGWLDANGKAYTDTRDFGRHGPGITMAAACVAALTQAVVAGGDAWAALTDLPQAGDLLGGRPALDLLGHALARADEAMAVDEDRVVTLPSGDVMFC